MAERPNPRRDTLVVGLLSCTLLVALWAVAAALAGNETLLPSPMRVGATIATEAASGTLFHHLGATLARVLAAFVLAMAIGCALGVWLGRRSDANRWADPWIVFLLNLPALVTIVLCFMWIGLTDAAAIAAVAINKIPMVTVIVREGARALDPKLQDMATVYRMSAASRLRHVVAPQLAPHLAAAARTGIALIWKIVLVAELLGAPNGVGFQIHAYFQLFDVGAVLAYAFSFIAVMLIVEYGVLQPWERVANRWRHAH